MILEFGPGFGCRSPACASRYRRVMLWGFVGIILFFLMTVRDSGMVEGF